MTDEQKLAKLKIKLNISDTSADSKLLDYLDSAEREIIAWMYTNYSEIPDDAEMPTKYEMVQIETALITYNMEGGEGETSHNENGISRDFKYTDSIDYVHDHVAQLV